MCKWSRTFCVIVVLLHSCLTFIFLFISGTFKFQKTDMRREGFDPNVVSDKLYFLDCTKGQYVELNPELHRNIISGKQKV